MASYRGLDGNGAVAAPVVVSKPAARAGLLLGTAAAAAEAACVDDDWAAASPLAPTTPRAMSVLIEALVEIRMARLPPYCFRFNALPYGRATKYQYYQICRRRVRKEYAEAISVVSRQQPAGVEFRFRPDVAWLVLWSC